MQYDSVMTALRVSPATVVALAFTVGCSSSDEGRGACAFEVEGGPAAECDRATFSDHADDLVRVSLVLPLEDWRVRHHTSAGGSVEVTAPEGEYLLRSGSPGTMPIDLAFTPEGAGGETFSGLLQVSVPAVGRSDGKRLKATMSGCRCSPPPFESCRCGR